MKLEVEELKTSVKDKLDPSIKQRIETIFDGFNKVEDKCWIVANANTCLKHVLFRVGTDKHNDRAVKKIRNHIGKFKNQFESTVNAKSESVGKGYQMPLFFYRAA